MALITLQPKQVAELGNVALKNTLGENAVILTEDLTNVVDSGTALENANAYKNFVENLMVATAKYIFRFRKYSAKAPAILRDNYEYGQLIQKIRGEMPDLSDNQTIMLEPNASYDDNTYTPNEVEVTLFMKQITFEVRKSITNKQIKNAFTSDTQLGNFVSMQFGLVQNRLELALEKLSYQCINNYMGTLVKRNTGANENKRVIPLLTMYKAEVPDADATLTADKALYHKGFLIYASAIINDYVELFKQYLTEMDADEYATFTPEDLLHVCLLSKFVDNMGAYAENSTFHNEFNKLPQGFKVNFWQGLGDRSIASRSKIDIKLDDGTSISQSYIIGFIFDHDALGINHDQPSVETHYVKSSQFTNYWYKEELAMFNDFSENGVIFVIQ